MLIISIIIVIVIIIINVYLIFIYIADAYQNNYSRSLLLVGNSVVTQMLQSDWLSYNLHTVSHILNQDNIFLDRLSLCNWSCVSYCISISEHNYKKL